MADSHDGQAGRLMSRCTRAPPKQPIAFWRARDPQRWFFFCHKRDRRRIAAQDGERRARVCRTQGVLRICPTVSVDHLEADVKMRNKFQSCFFRLHRKWLAKLPLAGQSGLLLPSAPSAQEPSSSLFGTSTTTATINAPSVDGSFAGGAWPQTDAPSEPPHLGPYTAALVPLDLSVVIPVYNAGPFIASLNSSIDQIRNVTYEVFCVNGASTDDSSQIISQLEETRPRMYSFQLLVQAPAGLFF